MSITDALTILVVLLPTVLAVAAEAVPKPLRESTYWRIGVIAFGIGLSALVGWQTIRTAKEAKADRQSAIDDTAKKTTESVTRAMGEQYNSLLTSLSTQNQDLASELSQQKETMETVAHSNIVTGNKPISVTVTNPMQGPNETKPEIHISRVPTATNSNYGRRAEQFIMTTSKVMNGGRVVIHCPKTKINNASALLAGAGMMSGGGSCGSIDEHTYLTCIQTPNWSPDFPLLVTVYFDADDLGPCDITPR